MKFVSNRFLKALVTLALCILMFISTFFLAIIMLVRPGNAPSVIKNTDLELIFGETEFAYYIVHQLNGLPYNERNLHFYHVGKFIQTDAFLKEFDIIMGDYMKALRRNNYDFHLTTSDVLRITKNLEHELNELFNHQMTQADQENFARTIDDIMDFRGWSVGGIIEEFELDNIVPFLRISIYLMLATGLLCIITTILIFIYFKRSIAATLLYTGIPIMLTGVMFLITWAILGIDATTFGTTLYDTYIYAAGFIHLIKWHGIVITGIGLIIILIFTKLNRKSVKKQKRQRGIGS